MSAKLALRRPISDDQSLVPNRGRRGKIQLEFGEGLPRRGTFDWATRRKPLAGRTLWMREPGLVLLEVVANPAEEFAGGDV